MHHAIAENVLAGNVMSRRATYQYGILLDRGADAQLDAAIGKNVSTGLITLIPPTDTIEATPTEITIDGVRMVFQYTPGTEAPAEMNTYLPQFEALWMAENCVATVHNLYTLRGAEVRDPLNWSKYINESIELFGAGTEVVFASHSWPRWGRQEAIEYLKKQRDLYGYLHDQTLRLANHGHTMDEIAELLVIPPALSEVWYNRGYHGTYNHNIKAVYQKYLGWYDGNPAHLHPLPAEASAPRYVEFMGGAERLLEQARAAFERGEYRWVAEVVNHLVFADPGNAAARELQADALEQLGFQAEGAGWRNSYLMAAKELRQGVPGGVSARSVSPDVIRGMSVDLVLDYLGVRLNGPKAEGQRMVLNFAFPDLATDYAVTLENSHLSYVRGKRAEHADATYTMPRPVLDAILLRQLSLAQAVEEGRAQVSGNAARFGELMVLMDDFEFWFDIVTP
jgi:alkyl sulfatase BDS1-like metallo-beta-lactamase superfamily hydrolase